MNLSERFEQNYIPVTESGCWIWIGSGSERPNMQVNGKQERAYRVAYELFVGPIPSGLFVCHKCDVPMCVNPTHLFLGTHLDNMRDASNKGRFTTPDASAQRSAQAKKLWDGVRSGEIKKRFSSPQGVANSKAKLTEASVLAIRNDPREQREIARDYGVSPSNIGYIKRGVTWKHISAAEEIK